MLENPNSRRVGTGWWVKPSRNFAAVDEQPFPNRRLGCVMVLIHTLFQKENISTEWSARRVEDDTPPLHYQPLPHAAA